MVGVEALGEVEPVLVDDVGEDDEVYEGKEGRCDG